MITCILLSHNKPTLLPEAILSVLAQTYKDWELLIWDSGVLADQFYFDALPFVRSDERIKLIRSSETAELKRKVCIASWCLNQAMRYASNNIICSLSDDDVFYKDAFQTFVDFFAAHPEMNVCYGAEDLVTIEQDGFRRLTGHRVAFQPYGQCVNGPDPVCMLDYLQCAYRREVLEEFPHPEELNKCATADGFLLREIGKKYPIWPVLGTIGQNRRTPWSVNAPAG